LGALATWLALFLMKPIPGDTSAYAIVAVIGAIVAFLWPLVFGFWMGRRVKQRREDSIEAEVQRQLAAEKSKQG
jgi:hypothetical protein